MNSGRNNFYEFEDFRLDPERGVLFCKDDVVDVTPKALEILRVLIENSGQVVSKDELLERAWPDSFVEEANLSHHIFKLRKALREDADHRLIETVPKRGYRFVGKLDRTDPPPETGPTILNAGKDRKVRVLIGLGLALIAIVAVTASWMFIQRKATVDVPVQSLADIRSIAVMPFVNESGSEDSQYLSDGVTETLISSLSRLPNLGVKPSSATTRYKGRDVSATTIGDELNVSAVLYGRMVQHGSDLTLFLSLIDTKTEYQVWGKQYVKKLAALAQLQDEIGRDVAQSLSTRLTPPDEGRLARNYSKNGEAYRLYLLGRFYWNKFTAEGLRKSIGCFEQAIALDGNYALAYTGLANSYNVMGVNAHIPVSEAGPKTKKAAETAVQLDNQLGEAHLALGAYKLFYEWDLAEAQREFKLTMELDPSLPGPHELSSYVLRAQRHFPEAIQEANLAIELDPLSRLTMGDLGTVYRFSGDPETAVEINNKIIEMDPTYSDVRFENGLALSQAGKYELAVEEIRNGLTYSGNSTHVKAGLGIVYARAGHKSPARKVIDELLAESGKNYVSPLDIALIYSAMNERDDAFLWLEKAYAEHSCWLLELNCDPDWEPIRSDPRFHDLAKRVGLDE